MKLTYAIVAFLPLAIPSPVHEPNAHLDALSERERANFVGIRDVPAATKFNPSFSAAGISPWSPEAQDDTLDNKSVWRICPENYLKCGKCPRDFRCQLLGQISKTMPTTKVTPLKTLPKLKPKPKYPRPFDPSEPAALTGPQLAHSNPSAESDTDYSCSLKKCGDGGSECHSSTTCVRGYCRCESDLKAASGQMARGWKYPESATVFVDAGAKCDVPCMRQFCAEIPRTSGCFEDIPVEKPPPPSPAKKASGSLPEPTSVGEVGQGIQGQSVGDVPVGSAGGGNGAIQVPGAVDVGTADFMKRLEAGGDGMVWA